MAAQQIVAHIHWHDTPGVFGGDHTDIPPNGFLYAYDADLSLGVPRRLGGYVQVGTTTGGESGIRGGYDWDPTGTSQIDVVITNSGTVFKETASGSGSYTALVTGLDMSMGPLFVQGGSESTGKDRKLFLFSGTNPVYVLAGTDSAMATIDNPPSDWDGADQPIFGFMHDSRMFAGGVRASPHRLYYSDDDNHEKFTTSPFRNSIEFDGSTTYLSRGADLTGNANGKLGTVSFWLNIDNGNNKRNMFIYGTASGDFTIRRTGKNRIRIIGLGTTATAVLDMESRSNWTHKGGWFHVMAAWDLTVPEGKLFINGKNDLASGGTFVNANIKYTAADHFVGANPAGGAVYDGEMVQFYLNFAEYLNLGASSNRKALYDNGAVDLATNAVGVVGATGVPLVFLNQGTATDWEINTGGGGDFTQNGTLVDHKNTPVGDLGGDPGSFNVFTGVGDHLIAGTSFKGFAILWKYPRGVFAVNTQDVDVVNWQQQILSHNISIAHPRAWVITEDNVIFMSSDGDFHAISLLQNEHQTSASITTISRFDQWMTQNLSASAKSTLTNPALDAVYYPDKKTALFRIDLAPGDGLGGNFVAIDFNKQMPRFSILGTAASGGLGSAWMSRDENGVMRPVAGGATDTTLGAKYFYYPAATTYGNTLASGGAWPQFNVRTPNWDFAHLDPQLANVRKNGRWLEVVYEPCTGTVTLAAEIFWDGNSYATITFPIAASTGVGYARRRLVGSGRTFGVRLYHPTPSTTTHAFAISNMNVYFVPGAHSPT